MLLRSCQHVLALVPAILFLLSEPALASHQLAPTSIDTDDKPAFQVYGFSIVEEATYLNYNWTVPLTVAWKQDRQLSKFAAQQGGHTHLKDGPLLDVLATPHSRSTWVQSKLAEAFRWRMDGLNFDLELPINSSAAAAYTALVQEAAQVFHGALPGSQVVVDVPWSPFDVDGRLYDWQGLAAAADLLLVMAYDMQSQIPGRCIASANSPIDLVHKGIRQWLGLGVSPAKLLLALPWYGYDYLCIPGPSEHAVAADADICHIAAVPFSGFSCSDAAGSQIGFADIMKLLHPGAPRNTTPVRWEPTQQVPYFNYQDGQGAIHQVWFDNSESLKLRYSLVHRYGLAGLGLWHLDALDYSSSDPLVTQQTRDMWGTLVDSLSDGGTAPVDLS